MELRTEARAGALLAAVLLAGSARAAEFRLPALHDHLRKGCAGTLVFDEAGVAFEEGARVKPRKHPHRWRWDYGEIQQLRVFPHSVELLTYKDSRWKLGADREYVFRLAGDGTGDVSAFLRTRLDQRLVSAAAVPVSKADWDVPAKHLVRTGGTEGVLRASSESLAFETTRKGRSRTWRYTDIDNVSTSGPFDLTVTTFERSRADYGDRKSFRFQLKQPLTEARYNELWHRVQQGKGLRFISDYRERNQTQ